MILVRHCFGFVALLTGAYTFYKNFMERAKVAICQNGGVAASSPS